MGSWYCSNPVKVPSQYIPHLQNHSIVSSSAVTSYSLPCSSFIAMPCFLFYQKNRDSKKRTVFIWDSVLLGCPNWSWISGLKWLPASASWAAGTTVMPLHSTKWGSSVSPTNTRISLPLVVFLRYPSSCPLSSCYNGRKASPYIHVQNSIPFCVPTDIAPSTVTLILQ
jgi:hypothetical protein